MPKRFAHSETFRAATSDKKAAKNWGNLVLAVDPELMGDKAEFAVRHSKVLAFV